MGRMCIRKEDGVYLTASNELDYQHGSLTQYGSVRWTYIDPRQSHPQQSTIPLIDRITAFYVCYKFRNKKTIYKHFYIDRGLQI